MDATTNQTRCVASTTPSPNKQDSRCGCARAVGETTPTASCPLQTAMTCSCLGTKRRGFSAHMSCTVTLRPLSQSAPLVRKMTSKTQRRTTFKLSVCMRAQNSKHQCTSTSGTVVCSRYSTVYYQTSPTKTDGVSESVQYVHEHAICDSQLQTCPPVLAQRCASYALPSDLERRTGVRHQRYPEAPRQPLKDGWSHMSEEKTTQPAIKLSTLQVCINQTPFHAHGASNHTMDTTGTTHPQKLR